MIDFDIKIIKNIKKKYPLAYASLQKYYVKERYVNKEADSTKVDEIDISDGFSYLDFEKFFENHNLIIDAYWSRWLSSKNKVKYDFCIIDKKENIQIYFSEKGFLEKDLARIELLLTAFSILNLRLKKENKINE